MRYHHYLSLISLASVATKASAWMAPATRSRTTPTAIMRLHRDQAQELADCAYGLMRQAKEEKVEDRLHKQALLLSRDISNRLRLEEETMSQLAVEEARGPVSWARRRLWPFSAGSSQQPHLEQGVSAKMP